VAWAGDPFADDDGCKPLRQPIGRLPPAAQLAGERRDPAPAVGLGPRQESGGACLLHVGRCFILVRALLTAGPPTLARSTQETLRLVLEAFPDLGTIDPDRLDFYIPSDPSGLAKEDISDYARISNPAWPDLSTSVVRVSILDAPGDNEHREFLRITQLNSKQLARSVVADSRSAQQANVATVNVA
jgi:hypothetical protein